ncbi:hypothetical protein FACS1894163_10500 [Spirochaetia bacterium]|nr:hypothetical protein FACS1894163_10500 [Spirochaetia bacterium]
MSQTELLMKEVEGLSPQFMEELIDFAGYLKHKPSPAKNRSENPYKAIEELEGFAKNLAEVRRLCKNSPVTVDGFIETRWKERDMEEAQFRRLFHHEGA